MAWQCGSAEVSAGTSEGWNVLGTAGQTLRLAVLAGVLWGSGFVLLSGRSDANAKLEGLRSSVQVFRVQLQNGREALVESQTAAPGDFIVYRVSYENLSRTPLRNFSPTLPIPNPMIYVANSAVPANVSATVDERNFAPVPLVRPVRGAGGTLKTVRVAPSEYRALRWKIPVLAPGQSVVLSARVQLPIPRRALRRDLMA